MNQINITKARDNLYQLAEQVVASHDHVLITGKQHNVVLVSQSDWDSMQETLYLMSIPGMRESIIEGMNTPTEECSKVWPW